jgi:hypothetical protein
MERANKLNGGKPTPLTQAQKSEIAEVRSVTESKIAQLAIMLDDKIKNAGKDPRFAEEIASARREFAAEREKIESNVESKIAQIKKG